MRIATLQFAPRLGEVEANASHADEMLAAADDFKNVDLLVCPEMALSEPHLEPTCAGPTALWAYRAASRLRCLVSIGYPETTLDPQYIPPRVPIDPSAPVLELCAKSSISQDILKSDKLHKAYNYNASLTVDPNGKIVAHYRKSFLYYTDATWSLPSPTGFETVSLPLPDPQLQSYAKSNDIGALSNSFLERISQTASRDSSTSGLPTAFGICMDLNPQYFTAPWEARELATHTLNSKASMLVVNTAWLTRLPSVFDDSTTTTSSSALKEGSSSHTQHKLKVSPCCPLTSSSKPDLDSLTYWLDRLSPLVEAERETVVVVANRIGIESGAVKACNLEEMANRAGALSAGAHARDTYNYQQGLGSNDEKKKDIEVNKAGAEPTAEFTKLVDLDSSELQGVVSREAHYAGTSAILVLGKDRVRVFGVLGRGEEKVLVADTSSAGQAIWRLAYKGTQEDTDSLEHD